MNLLASRHAGRSAARKYDDLAAEWFQRTFGKRTAVYVWVFYALFLIFVLQRHLPGRWALLAGVFMGLVAGALIVMPSALVPGYISKWQLGAWGEENTERELRKLDNDTWAVRHDVAWGDRSNHDHVIAGPAVFLLNTKHPDDSSIEIEDGAIRVRRLADPADGYLADRWVPSVAAEARSLRWDFQAALGFPVWVYPVIVAWADFAAEVGWIGDVAVVRGDTIAEWIAGRPIDLLDAEKRQRVMSHVRELPQAPIAGRRRRIRALL